MGCTVAEDGGGKREQRKSYGLERAKDQPRSKQQPSTKGLDISAEELRRMQESDTTLDVCMKTIDAERVAEELKKLFA